MTAEEYQRLSLRSFKGSKEYNFVNLSFSLLSAAGDIAHVISAAGIHYDLAFSDNDLNNAHSQLGCSVLRDVVYQLGDVLMTTSVFARHLGFSLEELMQLSLDKLEGRHSLDAIVRKRYEL